LAAVTVTKHLRRGQAVDQADDEHGGIMSKDLLFGFLKQIEDFLVGKAVAFR